MKYHENTKNQIKINKKKLQKIYTSKKHWEKTFPLISHLSGEKKENEQFK